jgi:hypothetical protein
LQKNTEKSVWSVSYVIFTFVLYWYLKSELLLLPKDIRSSWKV